MARRMARRGVGLLATALLAALGVTAATGLAAPSARTATGDNPVAEWHLDTTQPKVGTHLFETPDSSGNGLDATIVGTSVAGRFGNAFSFSAANANGAVVAQPGAILAPQNVTLLAWIKRSGSPGAYKYVLAKGARQCAAASYALESGPSGGLVFYIDDGTQEHTSPMRARASGTANGTWSPEPSTAPLFGSMSTVTRSAPGRRPRPASGTPPRARAPISPLASTPRPRAASASSGTGASTKRASTRAR